ncbi:MAG TPA: hypothetical protein VN742_11095, partial [Candidatus Binataceae bacterium]|nr:hypothetical protein [Candidatus Binataceae bacterium]
MKAIDHQQSGDGSDNQAFGVAMAGPVDGGSSARDFIEACAASGGRAHQRRCRGGGSGRHRGLKILWPKGRA